MFGLEFSKVEGGKEGVEKKSRLTLGRWIERCGADELHPLCELMMWVDGFMQGDCLRR